MKGAIRSLILSIATLFLVGWAITSLYDTYMQFAEITKKPEPPWEITLNLIPLAALVLFGTIFTIAFFAKKQKGEKPISFWLYPFNFKEEDEREKMISGEACRKAFISTWFTAPMIAASFAVYPLIQTAFPYYPILMVLLIPLVQIVVYYIGIRKIL